MPLQLVYGASPEERVAWHLPADASGFAYLAQSGCFELPGQSNAEEYKVCVRVGGWACAWVGAGRPIRQATPTSSRHGVQCNLGSGALVGVVGGLVR